MPPAGGHKVRRRAHQGSPPPRYGDKGYSSCFASVKETPIREALDRLFEGVARAEGGDLLGRDLHLLAGLGVPSLPGHALPHGELPEARDLDLLTSLERFGHYLLEGLEVLLSLALGHPSFLCDPLDELLLLHGCSFLWSPSAPRRACFACLRSRYTRAGSTCHPLAPSGFSWMDVVGAWCRRYTTFGTSLAPLIVQPSHRRPRVGALVKFDPLR